MNDFTKDELGYLYDELDSNYSELKNIPLMNKIQSMIEDYCEHDPKESSISYVNYFCTKCANKIT